MGKRLRASTSTYLKMRRRRLKFLKISAMLIVVAILSVSADYLWSLTVKWLDNTRWGRLQRIEVRGLDRMPRDVIVGRANLPMGISLFYTPFDSTAKLIEALPGIMNANCYRRIPGRLIVKVVEREPIMAIASKQLTLMDIEGVRFKPVGTFEMVDVPLLTTEGKVFRRKDMERSQELLVNIYEDYNTLYQHLSEIRVSKSGLTIILRQGGAEVILKDELNDKHLEILDAFLEQKSTILPPDMKYVDLRFGKMVIIGTNRKDV
jgi:cell division septal protein FtsQ